MSVDDLDFVTTEDLLDQLAKRFDHAAFTGMLVLTGDEESEEGEQRILRRWLGNTHTVAGLIEDLKVTMIRDYHERSEERPPRDEDAD